MTEVRNWKNYVKKNRKQRSKEETFYPSETVYCLDTYWSQMTKNRFLNKGQGVLTALEESQQNWNWKPKKAWVESTQLRPLPLTGYFPSLLLHTVIKWSLVVHGCNSGKHLSSWLTSSIHLPTFLIISELKRIPKVLSCFYLLTAVPWWGC